MLNDGECLLGSSAECDLVLTDVLAAPRQLGFDIVGEKISLKVFSDGVALNGKPLKEKQVAVEHFQFISFGTTHLAIGPAKGAWPAISLKDLHRDSTPSLGNPISNSLPVVEGALPEMASQVDAEGVASGHSSEAELGAPLQEDARGAGRVSGWIKGLIAITALVCLFNYYSNDLLRWAFLGGDTLSYTAPLQSDNPKLRLPGLLASLGLSESVSLEEKEGRFIMKGYVPSDALKRRLLAEVSREFPGVQVKVWSDEGLSADARGILNQLGLKLDVPASKAGHLQVKGYVPTKTAWDRAEGFLKSDVPGLIALDAKGIILGEALVSDITIILAKSGLDSLLTVAATPLGIAVKGALSDHLEGPWKTARSSIVEKLGTPLLLLSEVQIGAAAGPQAAKAKPLDFRIDSIIIGDGVSWLSVRNGKKYFPGAEIPNGYVVQSIVDDSVILTKGTDQVTLRVGDNLWVKEQ